MDNVALPRRRTAPRSTARGRSLVANNPYGTGYIAGWGRRVRLDRGILGVTAITVNTARHAADLPALAAPFLTAVHVLISGHVPSRPLASGTVA